MPDTITINAGEIYTGKGSLKEGSLTVSGGIITSVGKYREKIPAYDLREYILVPSYSDIHTHGYFGIDTYFSDAQLVQRWAEKLYSTGVTSFLPSLASLEVSGYGGVYRSGSIYWNRLTKTVRSEFPDTKFRAPLFGYHAVLGSVYLVLAENGKSAVDTKSIEKDFNRKVDLIPAEEKADYLFM